MSPVGPRFLLQRVCELLDGCHVHRTKAVLKVQELLGGSELDAQEHCIGLIASLEPCDFIGRVDLNYKPKTQFADTYVKRDDICLWYIKFVILIEEGQPRLFVHSCHETDRDQVKRHDGVILRKDTGQ